jgi:hypothetical protein
MNELELVSELRAGVPAPTAARLAVGRARLLDSISVRRRRPWAHVVAVAVGLALVAVAAVGVEGTGHQAPPPVVRVSLASQLLRTAARGAASRAGVIPRPGQWIYTRVVSYSLGGGRTASDGWLRFDGGAEAYYQGGRLIRHSVPGAAEPTSSPLQTFLGQPTPATAYRALASLPASPTRLLAEVAGEVPPSGIAGSGWDPARGRPTSAQLEFGFLAELLWNSAEAAPPGVEATVFSALSEIPGVLAQRGVSDALGRQAIALSIGGVDQQLLLDPRSYQVTGERTVSNGSWPVAAGGGSATVPKGDVVESLTWARVAFVPDPGRY